MTKPVPTIWTTGSTNVLNTGTWRSQLPIHHSTPSPCRIACPVSGDITRWLKDIKKNDFYSAWLALIQNNPLPAITGRVCHHPCQQSCNRSEFDEDISICHLERFVGDRSIHEGWRFPKIERNIGGRVAVIGSGPAGLSAAYQLRRLGIEVTIFEKQAELGGVLRYGIPEYRLPKDIVAAEIKRILELGVIVEKGKNIDLRDQLDKLEQDFDAIFIATGATVPKELNQLEAFKERVLSGATFLSEVNRGISPSLGERVIVIGGGSAALDVARSAKRLGSQVSILSLESIEDMPADPSEIKEASEEQILFLDSAMVVDAVSNDGSIALNCIRVNFNSQIVEPEPIEGTSFMTYADTIIVSIGQDPDLSGIDGILDTNGSLIVTKDRFQTNRQKIFAGGDLISEQRFVSKALGDGKNAALNIAQFINIATESTKHTETEPVDFKRINTFYYSRSSKIYEVEKRADERIKDFNEVRSGVSEEDAVKEADRCFSCGICVECNNCYYFCPDHAIIQTKNKDAPYEVQTQYCKGCGLCVAECPTGSIYLREERR